MPNRRARADVVGKSPRFATVVDSQQNVSAWLETRRGAVGRRLRCRVIGLGGGRHCERAAVHDRPRLSQHIRLRRRRRLVRRRRNALHTYEVTGSVTPLSRQLSHFALSLY